MTLGGDGWAERWRLPGAGAEGWGKGRGGMKVGGGGAVMFVMHVLMMSTGTGKITVELFSAEILFRVCKYLN